MEQHSLDAAFKRQHTSQRIGSSSIPELETYAMLLAGLGLLGFVVRRRKGAVE